MKKLLATLAVLLAAIGLTTPALAQESASATYAEPLRFAAATELLELRLQALAAAPEASEDDDWHESAEDDDDGPPIPFLALFAGSLAITDPGLLKTIEADLEETQRKVEADDDADLRALVERTGRHLRQARTALVPAAVADEPAFRAALIAQLAVSDDGVGEAYEDAAEGEEGAYALAWLTLQRIKALWAELAPGLTDAGDAAREVDRALAELSHLMPSTQVPSRFRDPEDAERAALDIVFALEKAVGRPLLLRGHAPALALVQHQAQAACTAMRDRQTRLALENLLAARATYAGHLESTLAVVAPDADADLRALWSQPRVVESDDGTNDICVGLQDAVARAAAAFG